jgi:hypothetical protein
MYKKNTCTYMFIAALFIIVKIWNQAWCPKTDAQIKDVAHIYSHIYSNIKKNEIMSFPRKWKELKIIILNEISQGHRQMSYFFLICGI